uniref:Uncharacterized protein n=1 Tax=Sphaerodactylus townsendi TaxID=933632 RepID=A0ACB8F8D0_9SAUR
MKKGKRSWVVENGGKLVLINGASSDHAEAEVDSLSEVPRKRKNSDEADPQKVSGKAKAQHKNKVRKESASLSPDAKAGQEIQIRGTSGWENSLRQRPPPRIVFQAGPATQEKKPKDDVESVEGFKERHRIRYSKRLSVA